MEYYGAVPVKKGVIFQSWALLLCLQTPRGERADRILAAMTEIRCNTKDFIYENQDTLHLNWRRAAMTSTVLDFYRRNVGKRLFLGVFWSEVAWLPLVAGITYF